ncbi:MULTISPECIES: hypothetical protein [Lactococcus]|uniref:NAD/FAD-utilizing enzyme apparently n=3 Tax=Lactococcus TaxID=1357 RepID=A0A0B8QTJ1_LACLL|nr:MULTISPECIES: hypothetical protein [Lactococcus]MDN5610281.1 hypothetical protein [Staphylococcus equorum]MDN6242383.1 hypothetical protein [Tetragenococcus koreensis]MDN6292136.1 hypothetical protein [Tetragenococcus halophilus]ARE20917.1 hypothetical protein LLUC06_1372 [Lactococcus lactis subsp. lactis]KST89216.1 hypothetical protein ATCC19435_0238 [Lactococcus lactis subsp. lactis]
MNHINNDIGALYLRGKSAEKIDKIQTDLKNRFSTLDFEYLWLPSLSSKQYFHPQNIESSHRNGYLVHAACLSFFDQEQSFSDGRFFGINRVHRLEPLRTPYSETRLECFNVFEIILTGDDKFLSKEYDFVKEAVKGFIEDYLKIKCEWRIADDSFIDSDQKKEELIFNKEGKKFSIASGNVHGDFFTKRKDIFSCCFGIGIERLFLAGEILEKERHGRKK